MKRTDKDMGGRGILSPCEHRWVFDRPGGLRHRQTSAGRDGPAHCLGLSGQEGLRDCRPLSLTSLDCPASDFNTLLLALVPLQGPFSATRPQLSISRRWDCPGLQTRQWLRDWQCRAQGSGLGWWWCTLLLPEYGLYLLRAFPGAAGRQHLLWKASEAQGSEHLAQGLRWEGAESGIHPGPAAPTEASGSHLSKLDLPLWNPGP